MIPRNSGGGLSNLVRSGGAEVPPAERWEQGWILEALWVSR